MMDAVRNMAGAEDYEEDGSDPSSVNIPGKDAGGGFIPDDDDDFVTAGSKNRKLSAESSVNFHLPNNDVQGSKPSETHPSYLKVPKKKKVSQSLFWDSNTQTSVTDREGIEE